MYSAGSLTKLKSRERCDACGQFMDEGVVALWMHYYGERPTQFAHYPRCPEDQRLRAQGAATLPGFEEPGQWPEIREGE